MALQARCCIRSDVAFLRGRMLDVRRLKVCQRITEHTDPKSHTMMRAKNECWSRYRTFRHSLAPAKPSMHVNAQQLLSDLHLSQHDAITRLAKAPIIQHYS